eukprot:SAG31_NODE_14688_length_792_cov_2.282828_1_plen_157_part_00
MNDFGVAIITFRLRILLSQKQSRPASSPAYRCPSAAHCCTQYAGVMAVASQGAALQLERGQSFSTPAVHTWLQPAPGQATAGALAHALQPAHAALGKTLRMQSCTNTPCQCLRSQVQHDGVRDSGDCCTTVVPEDPVVHVRSGAAVAAAVVGKAAE